MRTRAKPWLLENLRFAYYFLGVVYLALGLVMLGLEGLALLLRESPWGFLTGAAVAWGWVGGSVDWATPDTSRAGPKHSSRSP